MPQDISENDNTTSRRIRNGHILIFVNIYNLEHNLMFSTCMRKINKSYIDGI